MQDFESMAHVRWECKYHVVFIPKYRRKVMYGKLRKAVGRILRELCDQENRLAGGPRSGRSYSPVFEYSLEIRRFVHGGNSEGKECSAHSQGTTAREAHDWVTFWATGYWISTVGRGEDATRKYIREQEGQDRQQGELFE
jgi:putative transposase